MKTLDKLNNLKKKLQLDAEFMKNGRSTRHRWKFLSTLKRLGLHGN